MKFTNAHAFWIALEDGTQVCCDDLRADGAVRVLEAVTDKYGTKYDEGDWIAEDDYAKML